MADIKDALKRAAAASSTSTTSQQSAQSQSQSQQQPAQQQQPTQQHPDLRKQAPAQFEGETNPFTGEVGGPKRDPFVAGGGDWQYSGRVTVSFFVAFCCFCWVCWVVVGCVALR